MKKLILLAEDHKDVAEIVTVVLRLLGYDVALARDGIQAVERAIALHPDLIVMDIMMPNMNGLEAASQLRQHAETKSIPILAATAMATTEDQQKCLASGCNGYIAKPFTPKELAAAVNRLLREVAAQEPQQTKAP